MTQAPTPRNIGDDDRHADAQPSGVTPPHERSGMPRWVKVFAVVGIVVAALVIIMLFGGHGPGRHTDGTTHTLGSTAALGAPNDRPGLGS
jgi:hypothetical protein